MVIGSLNLRNLYKLKKYNGINNGIDNTITLNNLIKENNIDVLGVQELVRYYEDSFKTKISPDYKIVGKYRFGMNILVKNIDILNRFDESNSIITNQRIVDFKTINLPWFSSTLPRIAQLALIESKDLGKFVFINTHLDFLKEKVQIKQLKKLKKIISKIEYPIILCGDFNLEVKDSSFKEFVDYLDSIGIKRLSIDEPTYKGLGGKNIIDHIFVSKKFECESFKLIKTDDGFSDHNLLLVDIR